jgi:hypothetical protein
MIAALSAVARILPGVGVGIRGLTVKAFGPVIASKAAASPRCCAGMPRPTASGFAGADQQTPQGLDNGGAIN